MKVSSAFSVIFSLLLNGKKLFLQNSEKAYLVCLVKEKGIK